MSRPMPSADEQSRVFDAVAARVALTFADDAPAAVVHSALVASFSETCAVCGSHGAEQRLGHVDYAEGPSVCLACHHEALALAIGDERVTCRLMLATTYEAAVKTLTAREDARAAAECAGAA